uniref:GNAT family N-acetyltransferase n=1 Tax=Thaumasiovibrio occultus TaxID=1891184 RepID=UPI000B35E42D|nr:GNAT family N-acetyltransferase [Thaumasiovibrio occultus]
MEIKEISSIQGYESSLNLLLTDAIESGASVGFLTPVDQRDIESYWTTVNAELDPDSRRLFVAVDQGNVAGTVQLSICTKPNGSHRGEVEKLMVHTRYRGLGLSKRLMALMESSASAAGLSLLVLDTRFGDIASSLYRSLGYTEAGTIPQFARSSSGELEATVYFYKQL